jgi:hypothetical protein
MGLDQQRSPQGRPFCHPNSIPRHQAQLLKLPGYPLPALNVDDPHFLFLFHIN